MVDLFSKDLCCHPNRIKTFFNNENDDGVGHSARQVLLLGLSRDSGGIFIDYT